MIDELISWVSQWPTADDEVVWVVVAKVDVSWRRDQAAYIQPGGTMPPASRGKYEKVGNWVVSGRPVWMSHVSLDDNGDVSFTDGRHRFAWMRGHGVRSLPVTTAPDQARAFRARFGSRSRTCRLPNARLY